MKRDVLIVIILGILLVSSFGFVIGAETNQSPQIPNASALKNIPSQVGTKSNEVLSQEIQIPAALKTFAKFIFGIRPEQHISLEEGIVLVALWFLVLLMMVSLVGSVAGKLIKWAISVVIMILISIGGGFYQGSMLILGLTNLFSFTSKNRMIGMFFALVIIGVIGWGLIKIFGKFKNVTEVTKAKQTGVKVGAGAAMGKKVLESLGS